MNIQFTNFEELTTVVNKLDILEKSRTVIKNFDTKFIEISNNADEVYNNNNGELFMILPNGSVSRLVIYIADLNNYNNQWMNNGLPKYHPYECGTIKKMKYEERGYRYVSTGKYDGNFWTIRPNKVREYTKRQICQNCYKKYKEYNSNKFNLEEYLNSDESIFESFNDYADSNDITPRNYPSNWEEISRKIRQQADYICQQCGFNGGSYEKHKYIDCHHMNADRSNSNKDNLRVLCIYCHSKQFHHSHIKLSKRYKEFKQKYGSENK